MKIKIILWGVSLLAFSWARAQNDSIVKLREVVIADARLWSESNLWSKQKLNDSVIALHRASLTQLLQFNTLISFKQNGFGMVSSPTFRGTTAQQTAVIWNGVNINSNFNGQTDFNTLSAGDYDQVVVRAGGGSVAYGSSAIGGSVHLNNQMVFSPHLRHTAHLSYGSFQTTNWQYKLSAGSQKWFAGGAISSNRSENDYPLLGTSGLKNQNGQFQNINLQVQAGYRINQRHLLQFWGQTYDSERHFSGPTGSWSTSVYRDLNQRNLGQWTYQNGAFTSRLKGIYLAEQYHYYPDFTQSDFQTARSVSAIGQSELSYSFQERLTVQSVVSFTRAQAHGSQLGSVQRNILTASLNSQFHWSDRWTTEAGIRQEQASDYQSPFLFSLGTVFKSGPRYQIRAQVSRNYRIPTFNDLYWQPGGNLALKPEHSLQVEVGQEWTLQKVKWVFTIYHNSLRDLIQWTPQHASIWRPVNIASVQSYGFESSLNRTFLWGSSQIELQAGYGFTVSEDQQQRQLTYVPRHKWNANAAWALQHWRFYTQLLYSGQVYTQIDQKAVLTPYAVSNAGISYQIPGRCDWNLGLQVWNLTNELYQSTPDRPMPGRNYQLQLTLKL